MTEVVVCHVQTPPFSCFSSPPCNIVFRIVAVPLGHKTPRLLTCSSIPNPQDHFENSEISTAANPWSMIQNILFLSIKDNHFEVSGVGTTSKMMSVSEEIILPMTSMSPLGLTVQC